LNHKADATAKYGKPANVCRAAHIPALREDEIFSLDIGKYKGGVALWGAVPAVYDTTRLSMDRGIHVHARVTPKAKKEMDCTFRAVRIVGNHLSEGGLMVPELDAIYYMVTSVFGYKMRDVRCSYCDYPHLDRDWFSVHPHRRHLCAGCGKHFTDTEIGVGNPIVGVRDACRIQEHKSVMSTKKLEIKQADFPGGIQVWGSNSAFLWTSDSPEEEGIHVHGFRSEPKDGDEPDLDETYGEVSIDGVKFDPSMVRILMAQNTLPSLKNRIQALECPSCHELQFDVRELAFTPALGRRCTSCDKEFTGKGKVRKVVSNPLPVILKRLAKNAPRDPQSQDLELFKET
jgi:transposase-like protein